MTETFYDKVSIKCSRLITQSYSTSFSLGILCLEPKLRDPIYSIYGFVRLADEIVDTFHNYNKAELLKNFKNDTYKAINDRISLNPMLHNFQIVVRKYEIDHNLIEQFLNSMEMDLSDTSYDENSFSNYILGSAEAIGLMCLKVFCADNTDLYDKLAPFAMRLGAAFQKVNFLRDLKADYENLGRSYFPNIDMSRFDNSSKIEIEKSIEEDFHEAYKGIRQLPNGAKHGVYLAYIYYLQLFYKIKKTPSERVMEERIRVPNQIKFSLLFTSYIKARFNLI